MPELPEVETMRRGVAPVVGSHILAVRRPRSRLRPIRMEPSWSRLRRRLLQREIIAVDRCGKRVVIVLDSDDRLVIEPRMSGLILLADPPDIEHVRLILELDHPKHRELLFWNQRGLGVVRLLAPVEYAAEFGATRIGPDALAVSADELRERLGASRRAIKVALLDQRAVAGIGNLYAAEILHRARVHPETMCRQLRPAEWKKIQAATSEVLAEAIVHQGSTLRDGTYRIARNEPGAYQFCHRVYQREGERCVQCRRATIVRIVQAQRSTFFCPGCQKRRP